MSDDVTREIDATREQWRQALDAMNHDLLEMEINAQDKDQIARVTWRGFAALVVRLNPQAFTTMSADDVGQLSATVTDLLRQLIDDLVAARQRIAAVRFPPGRADLEPIDDVEQARTAASRNIDEYAREVRALRLGAEDRWRTVRVSMQGVGRFEIVFNPDAFEGMTDLEVSQVSAAVTQTVNDLMVKAQQLQDNLRARYYSKGAR